MDAIGIVCEYNPFHAGHLFHIEESKRLLGRDAVIVCVMSGDYVQRGEAAAFSKFARAEAACRAGANVVFELPLPWCISSAETFADGAVSLLAAAGCTALSFGSETDALEPLWSLAQADLKPEIHERILQGMRADGTLSYAQARQQALEKCIGESIGILSHPNNILAVEYLKAIQRHGFGIQPLAVKRLGADHDSHKQNELPSALQLRRILEAGGQIDAYLPKAAARVLKKEITAGHVFNRDRMELAMLSRLYSLDAKDFESLTDASNGAGQHLYHILREGRGIEGTVRAATTKKYTAARMRRILLSAALGIKNEDAVGAPPYLRLLAADQRGREYLRELTSPAVPIVTKPASVKNRGERAAKLFAMNAKAHDLYTLQFVTNDNKVVGEDWRRGPCIV